MKRAIWPASLLRSALLDPEIFGAALFGQDAQVDAVHVEGWLRQRHFLGQLPIGAARLACGGENRQPEGLGEGGDVFLGGDDSQGHAQALAAARHEREHQARAARLAAIGPHQDHAALRPTADALERRAPISARR